MRAWPDHPNETPEGPSTALQSGGVGLRLRFATAGVNLGGMSSHCALVRRSSLVIVAVVSGWFSVARAAEPTPPNLVVIVADDLGYGDLGRYGQELIATPTLDRLADEGTRFTQAYGGSAVCSPSRGSLMTGLHTGHARIRGNFARVGGLPGRKGTQTVYRVGLAPEDKTLADHLKPAGFTSGLVNKWHLDGFDPSAGPLDRGFDWFRGWLVTEDDSNTPYYFPAKRFDQRNYRRLAINQNGAKDRHGTDISTDDAIDFLRQTGGKPFFLYLAYDAPHEPYVVANYERYADRDWTDQEKAYATLITQMDRAIARVLRELDDMGARDNTIVLFVSDNGAWAKAPHARFRSGGGLRGFKGDVYEGGIRVPAFVRWPGKVPAGRVSDEPWCFADLMPTLSALAGVRPTASDGQDLSPLWLGKTEHLPERVLYWEFPESRFEQAARQGAWKAVRHAADGPIELYNLAADPTESHDLAASEPERVAAFRAILAKEHVDSPYWPTR